MNCGTCGNELSDLGRGWEFFVSLEPPSQNVVSGNKGSIATRAKYKRFRDDYIFLFKVWRGELRIPPATGKRRVFITRVFSGRGNLVRDRGNLIGGCKPLLDALTVSGLIVDDMEGFLEDHYAQVRGKEKGVRIQIWEMNE